MSIIDRFTTEQKNAARKYGITVSASHVDFDGNVIELNRAGRVANAERLYLRTLSQMPAEATHSVAEIEMGSDI